MLPNRGPVRRSRRLGAAFFAAALVAATTAVAAPVTASAQDSGSTLPETGNSSVDAVLGQIPDEIVIGGALGDGLGGSEAAQSVGKLAGSVALLEAVGISGGSAAASVASSGSLPGSVYTNPVGSIGSGTIGIGSLAISEYIIPVLGLQVATAYVAALAERQEAGTLEPHELDFWHGVVGGSAEGGAVIQDVADATGTELPSRLAGSIDSVQIAAQQDPYEANERRRVESEAAAQAASEAETAAEGEAALEGEAQFAGAPAGAAAFAATGGAETGVAHETAALDRAGDPGQAAPARSAGAAEQLGQIPAVSIGA